jgi:nucleoside-diphosphate-sugar epimerase
MKILIIGGTRNMGHFLTEALHRDGHTVTVLNRGLTRSDLPDGIEHLRADRSIASGFEAAVSGRTFDAVVDFALFSGTDAEVVADVFQGKVGHYIFISSGQVYLIRDGVTRPYHEEDYDGALIDTPALNTYDHEEWTYGNQKRQAEDTLARAHTERAFPYTALRLPMVNSPRDPFGRLYGYLLRLRDNGPVLIPDTPDYALRHVAARDVVTAILTLLERGTTDHRAYNISQDETLTLTDFLTMLGELVGIAPRIVRTERVLLDANGFLPDCSPFSDVWMSELDNTRSKDVLGMTYTPMRTYVADIVQHYNANPPQQPVSYRRRHAEIRFAEQNS